MKRLYLGALAFILVLTLCACGIYGKPVGSVPTASSIETAKPTEAGGNTEVTEKPTEAGSNTEPTEKPTEAGGNTEVTEKPTEPIVDTTPPVITLNGEGEIWMKAGQEYSDAGCTAQDTQDGDLTDRVTLEGSVNRYHAGDYTLTYSVEDSAGNTGTARRIVHVEPQRQPDGVTPTGKIVYLTFDDGPGPYTQKLLDVLEAYNVKVTFFVTGYRPQYNHLIGAEYAAGHSVGIHTYSHDYRQIYQSKDAYFADLEQIQAIIEAQTGQKTTLLRFPGGSSNTVSKFTPGIMTALVKDVTDRGFQYFDWNVASGDAEGTVPADTVFQNVVAGIQKHDISIVLQHDIMGFSVDAVEAILAWGIQNGYTFLPLTPTSPTVHHRVFN